MKQHYSLRQIVILICTLNLIVGLSFSASIYAKAPSEANPDTPGVNRHSLTVADLPSALQSTLLETVPQKSLFSPLLVTTAHQQAKLTAANRAEIDNFGAAVASNDEAVFIGTSGDDSQTGAVYVFAKPVDGWADATETAKLAATNGTAGDLFGWAVAVSGNTLIIGARGYDNSKGAAYIFEKPETGSWADVVQIAKLTASDGMGGTPNTFGDSFGNVVDISGNTVIIGTSIKDNFTGAVYLFEKPTTGWVDATETTKLTGSSQPGDLFGSAIAINGDTVITGANGVDSRQGAVYVFEKPNDGWANIPPIATLTASDRPDRNSFGGAVAINGDTVIVGAENALGNNPLDFNAGAAYLFEKPATGWLNNTENAKLTASDRAENDFFGASVAISSDNVMIGAFGKDTNRGVAYFFEKPASGWANTTQTAKLTASDRAENDVLGSAVAVSNDTAFIGANGKDRNRGATYIFSLQDIEPRETKLYIPMLLKS